MKERIELIIERKNINKAKFAEALNVSQAFVSQLCSGAREPSARTIKDICTKFGVDETWLRTGEGDPFQEEPRRELIMKFATQTVTGSDEFKKAFVSMLAKLDAEDWEALARLYQKLSNEIDKKSE